MEWPRADVLACIQQAGVFPDCKQFVDMPLRAPLEQALLAFDQLYKSAAPTIDELKAFIHQYFDLPGSDVAEAQPHDWCDSPTGFLPNVGSPNLRAFGHQVHALWSVLCRKVLGEVASEPDLHTLLHIPHLVVVPGDRFREVYYWDTFWIIKGLLTSGMQQTATNMVHNLLDLIDKYGFIPNGTRSYYLNRSQPPLLSAMVDSVWKATQNRKLLECAVPLLVKEHDYWTSGDKVVLVRDEEGDTHSLARYYADWYSPRPESYREDMHVAEGLSQGAAAQLYCDIASAAESGWDFSSRWFADSTNMSTIRTTKVVPVDLNAFLYQMETNISVFAMELGDQQLAARFKAAAQTRLSSIQCVMWNSTGGCWYDLVLESQDSDGVWSGQQNQQAFASNWIPLWCGCCDPGSNQAELSVASLQDSGLVQPAGVATSLNNTGQQWDFPNAWPPLQHMLVEGLASTDTYAGQVLAAQLAFRWIQTCLVAFKQTGHMHEKYDAREIGSVGGGGEYVPQTGFGWSNGVVLNLLEQYGPLMG